MGIEWTKFKKYKEHIEPKEGQTNLGLLVAFLKDTQGLHVYDDIHEAICSDELGRAMLDKSGIGNADELMNLYFRKA